MIENVQVQPWSFTIEFDSDKAARHGYDLDTLYDYVGKNVERFGLTRIGKNTWKARVDDEVSPSVSLFPCFPTPSGSCKISNRSLLMKMTQMPLTALRYFERPIRSVSVCK